MGKVIGEISHTPIFNDRSMKLVFPQSLTMALRTMVPTIR